MKVARREGAGYVLPGVLPCAGSVFSSVSYTTAVC